MSRAEPSLRVLITNHQLGEPGGTEVNVRDWAVGLRQRGHRPVVYSPVLGRTAQVLRDHAIEVTDDLAQLAQAPDVIHGSHSPTIIESIVRFPSVPALQLCQSLDYPMSEPLFLPQVRRFVAVDERTRDYLIENGAPAALVRVILNAVDLQRIPARAEPLPERPQRALIFTKNESHIPFIEEACRRAGIAVTALGRGVGSVVLDPERELARCDLVFATARSALEAIAAGAATIVVDARGLAGMATRKNAANFRPHNYGARVLQRPVTVESITAEIARYDAAEATALSAALRPEIDLERQLDQFESLYDEMLVEHRAAQAGTDEFLAALGPVLHRFLPRFPGTDWPWQFERADLLARVAELDAALARERREVVKRLMPAELTSRRLAPPFARGEGVSWVAPLSSDPLLAPMQHLCNDLDHARRSPLQLLEDGVALGPAHAMHASIAKDGAGRYSHWTGNALVFSTSDNSDPNTNGRNYSVEWIALK